MNSSRFQIKLPLTLEYKIIIPYPDMLLNGITVIQNEISGGPRYINR